MLEGILWVLRSGARWTALPRDNPPYQTCHRRFQQWGEAGGFAHITQRLATDLIALGWVNFAEWFIDGTNVPTKKEGPASAKPSAAKAPG